MGKSATRRRATRSANGPCRTTIASKARRSPDADLASRSASDALPSVRVSFTFAAPYPAVGPAMEAASISHVAAIGALSA